MNQITFTDVTAYWRFVDEDEYLGCSLYAYKRTILLINPDESLAAIGSFYRDQMVGPGGEIIARRKPIQQPNRQKPKYVPFANAEEARSVVGWEPWIKQKVDSDYRRKVDTWTRSGEGVCFLRDLFENYLWSNTPDDDDSWKPFGKLVTE